MGLRRGLGFCISVKLPGDTDAAGWWPYFGKRMVLLWGFPWNHPEGFTNTVAWFPPRDAYTFVLGVIWLRPVCLQGGNPRICTEALVMV